MRTRGSLKWVICGLLLGATVLNYLDRQVLSLTAEKIIEEKADLEDWSVEILNHLLLGRHGRAEPRVTSA